jgi:hypothetical protein
METPEQYAWQQQPQETDKAFQAFVVYRNLEPEERSLQRVSSELSKSIPLMKRWSARWSWAERVREWDGHQEIKLLERRIEQKQKMDEDHLKIIRAARSKAVQALAKVDPEKLLDSLTELRYWITEMVKLERLIMGEPESIEERRSKVEVRATIEERLKAYAPVFQELLDEGAITMAGREMPMALDPDGDNVDDLNDLGEPGEPGGGAV